MLALDAVGEALAACDFRIEPFCWQIEDAEVGCVRRRKVLGCDLAGLSEHALLECLDGRFDLIGVAGLGRRQQSLVVLAGELGIDR